jgi:hypothetical protein
MLSMTPKKVARWRERFLALGVAGLQKDAPRPGPTPTISARLTQRVVTMTTQQQPRNATHWSTRTMAAAVGISPASVRRIRWTRLVAGTQMLRRTQLLHQLADRLFAVGESFPGCEPRHPVRLPQLQSSRHGHPIPKNRTFSFMTGSSPLVALNCGSVLKHRLTHGQRSGTGHSILTSKPIEGALLLP